MATITIPESLTSPAGVNRWDSPWLNRKFVTGLVMVMAVLLMGVIGGRFWSERLALVASSPLNLPPAWVTDPQFIGATLAHPLGTESNGRDILAVLITGAPRSFQVGLIAAGLGIAVGIVLGFTAGFLGGWVDNVIRTLADSVITIPTLALLIVVSSYVRVVDINSMALILALFAWAGPTRLIRAQVLSMRERGYVRMARLSGVSTFDIMFREMLPNMMPYLASSLAGNVAGRDPGGDEPRGSRTRSGADSHAGHDDLLRHQFVGGHPGHVVVVGVSHPDSDCHLQWVVLDGDRSG